MPWFMLWVSQAFAFPCGLQAHLPEIAATPFRQPVTLTTSGELEGRDPFEIIGREEVTPHFSIRWGANAVYNQDLILEVGEVLEEIWTAEVETLGYPAPRGTDAYRLNVYVGDTGGGTPSAGFSIAYVTVDGEGYPYMVLSPYVLEAAGWGDFDTVRSVIAHEFFHTLQLTTEAYLYEGQAGWFWEATANWIVQHVDPYNSSIGSAVGAYAVLPHLSVALFDYPDEGTLSESHHYGAEVFISHLDEDFGGPDLIRDAWTDASPKDLPLEVLDDLLVEQGASIDQAFSEFVTRNSTFGDYLYSANYQASLDLYTSFFPEEARRYAAILASDGTEDWETPRESYFPRGWGYNHIRWINPSPGRVLASVRADELGSEGSASRWFASVIRITDEGVFATPVLEGGIAGETEIITTGDEDEVLLAVAAHPDTWLEDERFGYQFQLGYLERFTAEPGAASLEPIQEGCTCGSRSSPLSTLAAWFGLTLVWSRKRQQHAS